MSCGCPTGYDFNSGTGLCERLVLVPATIKSNPKLPTYGCSSEAYMRSGTVVYPTLSPSQFPLNGINAPVPSFTDHNHSIIAPIATILSGNLWISGGSLSSGRLNQAGISLYPSNDWQGYNRCIYVNPGDVYAVALSSTNSFRVFVDGVLAIFYSNNLQISASEYLYVFPLSLSEGNHSILFEGLSATGNTCDSGSFVCEIYKNISPQILSNISTQEQLNDYYAGVSINGIGEAISTLYLIGNATDTGISGNYSCSVGYMNSCVDGQVVCKYLDVVSPIPCCFTLTNCVSGAQIHTKTNLNNYLNKIIKVAEFSGCYVVSAIDVECSSDNLVTVTSFYDNCVNCTRIYYKLIDCTGISSPLITTQNLAIYVGKIVRISNHNVCWIVVIDQPTTHTTNVDIVQSYLTCEDCL